MEFAAVASATCIVRNTAALKGRTESVAPGLTASLSIAEEVIRQLE